jgi:hypothetical protein
MRALIKTGLLFFLFFIVCHNSFSQDSKKKNAPIRLLLDAGLSFGGDEIAEVLFTNGEKQSVRAGQGIAAGVGFQLQIPSVEKFLLRSTVGFKYVTTAADNVHIRLTRIPINISGNYMATPKLRLGAGISMHQNIQFKTDGLGGDYKLNPATGAVFEIAYSGIALSYTAMKYKDQANKSYSANAIGLSYSIAIPKM